VFSKNMLEKHENVNRHALKNASFSTTVVDPAVKKLTLRGEDD
jgi:hypothetical protein